MQMIIPTNFERPSGARDGPGGRRPATRVSAGWASRNPDIHNRLHNRPGRFVRKR